MAKLYTKKLVKTVRAFELGEEIVEPATVEEISAACPVCAARKTITGYDINRLIEELPIDYFLGKMDVAEGRKEFCREKIREWLTKLGR